MSYPDQHSYAPLLFDAPDASPDHPTVTDWQRHLDAGRIGGNPPCPPEVAAQRDATARLFAGYACDRRRAAREHRA